MINVTAWKSFNEREKTLYRGNKLGSVVQENSQGRKMEDLKAKCRYLEDGE